MQYTRFPWATLTSWTGHVIDAFPCLGKKLKGIIVYHISVAVDELLLSPDVVEWKMLEWI